MKVEMYHIVYDSKLPKMQLSLGYNCLYPVSQEDCPIVNPTLSLRWLKCQTNCLAVSYFGLLKHQIR